MDTVKNLKLIIITMTVIFCASCGGGSAATASAAVAPPIVLAAQYKLSTDQTSLSYKQTANSAALNITSDAPKWTLVSNAAWIQTDIKTGVSGTTKVIVSTAANTDPVARSGKITISSENATTIEIAITQKQAYPSYNSTPAAAELSGVGSTASELAKKIGYGFNIGNTLEATGGETAWGNPTITNELIKLIKKSGFNAIRLPVSWNQYANQDTAKIDPVWLSRVKEVAQYCVDNELYVIVNIHWDGGWLENNVTPEKQAENNLKQKAFWEQIATLLRDFDEHVIFASANEPNVDTAAKMDVLLSYHQTFIDAVRATGGKNAYRVLVVQGPNTDIEMTNKLMTTMPADKVKNRLMAEIHFYTPYNFTGMTKDESWGNQFYYWGKNFHSTTDIAHNPTWGEEDIVDKHFALMKQQFVDKGIPVVIGEFGATRRTDLTGEALKLHLDSRAYYFKYVTQQAKLNGLLPFHWDGGASGVFDRKTNTVMDQQSLDALTLK